MELWAAKAIEYSKVDRQFWGSLKEKNVERYAGDGGLACEILMGSLGVTQDFRGCCVFAIFNLDSVVLIS